MRGPALTIAVCVGDVRARRVGDRQPEQVADAGDRDQQADAPIDGSAAR
jgi:hypothetical protein